MTALSGSSSSANLLASIFPSGKMAILELTRTVISVSPTTPITITIMNVLSSAGTLPAVAGASRPRSGGGAASRLWLRISLRQARPRIRNRKGAVRFGCDLDVLPFAIFLHIRDAVFSDVVVFVRLGSVVQLPQIFQPRRVMHDLPSCRTCSLARTIVDHRDSRMERPHQRLWIR